MWCNGIQFPVLKTEYRIDKNDMLEMIVNTQSKKPSVHFKKNGKYIPHCITCLPKEGVYVGFSCWGPNSIQFISLQRSCISPPPPITKCVGYKYNGNSALRYEDNIRVNVLDMKDFFQEDF